MRVRGGGEGGQGLGKVVGQGGRISQQEVVVAVLPRSSRAQVSLGTTNPCDHVKGPPPILLAHINLHTHHVVFWGGGV
jgi:hypothetical protein